MLFDESNKKSYTAFIYVRKRQNRSEDVEIDINFRSPTADVLRYVMISFFTVS